MSFKRFHIGRRAAVVAVILALSGCGFRPLYAPPAEDVSGKVTYAFETFRHTHIAGIEDRPGQYLRNRLVRLLHPNGAAPQPALSLVVKLTESTQNLAVRKSSEATRAVLRMTAQYYLTRISDQKLLIVNDTSATSGYNIFDSEYQTLAALQGARDRALDTLAEQIRIRLATDIETQNIRLVSP